jgi:isoleucyl-tRNA synthetase
VITRYATQTGHYVERRFGWDCHGLPVEHEIDKKLGIKTKEDLKKVKKKQNQKITHYSIIFYNKKDWYSKIQ